MAVRRVSQPTSVQVVREAEALATGALALFLVLSLFSYTPDLPRSNLGGPVGHALADTVLRALGLAAYLFPVALVPIDLEIGARAPVTGSLIVRTAPNEHGSMPNFAVRIEAGTRALVYSSDTRPSEAVVGLARGADPLVHEATFAESDRPAGRAVAHSSAADAGRVAASAGARRLILTHVGAEYHADIEAIAEEARRYFAGPVEIAEELRVYSF